MRTDFAGWSAAPPSWAAGSELGPVLSTRVRLARNLAGQPFPHHASPAARSAIVRRVFEVIPSLPACARSQCFSLSDLGPDERRFLMERQLMSRQHAGSTGVGGLAVVPGEVLSIMVNEEDHIRAASFASGLSMDQAWTALAALDDQICGRLPVAFAPDYGFATACPTNLGTGMRVSCLVHLPASVMTRNIDPLLHELGNAGLTARGFFGEGTTALGDLFQISNSQTLGRSEAQIIRIVERAVRQVVQIEARAAVEIQRGPARTAVEDAVHRAFGTLSNARLLEYDEAMRLMSLVRMGLRAGMRLQTSPDALNDLLFLTQPSHLRLGQGDNGRNLEPERRAKLVRERLAGQIN